MTHQLKLAILQTGRAPQPLRREHGDYDDMCANFVQRAPYDITSYSVVDGEFPEAPENHDAFLITGSPHGAYEDHDWIPPLEELIRAAYKRGTKIVGICFGHQIVAQALGGQVVMSEKGFGTGVMDYQTKIQDGTVQSIALHAWHQDQVIRAPQGAEIISASEFCPIAGLRYGDIALTFQAHPEFTKDFMLALTNFRSGDTLPYEDADITRLSLKRDVDAAKIETMVVDFLTLQ